MLSMKFVKNKTSIKYFCFAAIILVCLYSNVLSKFFVPLFDDIYYGNLTNLFVAVVNAIIWGLEVLILVLVAKKLSVNFFTEKENKGELKLWKVFTLFALAIIPILIISASIGWKVKIVHALGERVTIMGLLCNVCEMLAYAVRMVLMIMFISCIQKSFEGIIATKLIVPYGAILAILTFGLIDFFFFPVAFNAFYLVMSFLYGVIYLVADKKFALSYLICYLIYLL